MTFLGELKEFFVKPAYVKVTEELAAEMHEEREKECSEEVGMEDN